VTTQDPARALKRIRARAEQAERHARRMRDQRQRWDEERTRLTRTELEAGVSCRGCARRARQPSPDVRARHRREGRARMLRAPVQRDRLELTYPAQAENLRAARAFMRRSDAATFGFVTRTGAAGT
jgi:hypothetical protein